MRKYAQFWLPMLVLVITLILGSSCANSGTDQQNESTSGGSSQVETQEETTHSMQGMAMGMAMTAPSTAGLKVDFTSNPADPQPNQATALRYLISDSSSGTAVTDFPIEHEVAMHLIIVSQDLSQFQHIHPELGGDDAWAVSTTFPEAAHYVLFDEFVYNGEIVLDRREFPIGQAAQTSASLSPDVSPKTVDGLTVSLSAPEIITAGQDAAFTVHVTRDGQPVTDLEPYLGAPAHVVIVSSDTHGFVHTHGEVPGMVAMDAPSPRSFGPDISFANIFPRPGLYKMWTQFGYQGNVVRVPFVIAAN